MAIYNIDHAIISAEAWVSILIELATAAAAAQAADPACEPYVLGLGEAVGIACAKYLELSRIVNILRESDDCR